MYSCSFVKFAYAYIKQANKYYVLIVFPAKMCPNGNQERKFEAKSKS